jgi:hypothetical protein
MSKTVAAPRKEKQSTQAKPAPVFKPLKPHRKLAVALLVIFLVWIVILYVMYFTTVHGH